MSVHDQIRSKHFFLSLHLNRHELLCLLIDDQWTIIADDSFEHRSENNGSVLNLLESIGKMVYLSRFVFIIIISDGLFQKLRDQKMFDFANIVGISGR